MAVVEQQLVLVGGIGCNRHNQSTVLTWDSTSHRWTIMYLNMPIGLTSAAAVGYQEFLVVVGGASSEPSVTTVMIPNSSTKQWSTASPLLTGCKRLTPALVGHPLPKQHWHLGVCNAKILHKHISCSYESIHIRNADSNNTLKYKSATRFVLELQGINYTGQLFCYASHKVATHSHIQK